MSRSRCASPEQPSARSTGTSPNCWLGWASKSGSTRRLATLSGGERQLVAVARAIVARPELLIADEPTSNIDEDTAQLLARILQSMNRLGTTVLIATRNASFARPPGGRELRLENGKLSACPCPVERNRRPVGTGGNVSRSMVVRAS